MRFSTEVACIIRAVAPVTGGTFGRGRGVFGHRSAPPSPPVADESQLASNKCGGFDRGNGTGDDPQRAEDAVVGGGGPTVGGGRLRLGAGRGSDGSLRDAAAAATARASLSPRPNDGAHVWEDRRDRSSPPDVSSMPWFVSTRLRDVDIPRLDSSHENISSTSPSWSTDVPPLSQRRSVSWARTLCTSLMSTAEPSSSS